MLSDIIIPSPVGKTAEMMPRTAFYGAVLASLEGKNPTSVGDDVSPCKNTSNNTGAKRFIFQGATSFPGLIRWTGDGRPNEVVPIVALKKMIAIKPVSSFDMLHQVGLLDGWVGKKIGIVYE